MIVCVPAASALVENVAIPEERVADPSVFAPSINVTVPVGVAVLPVPAVAMAVNVTLVPVEIVVAEAVRERTLEASVAGEEP